MVYPGIADVSHDMRQGDSVLFVLGHFCLLWLSLNHEEQQTHMHKRSDLHKKQSLDFDNAGLYQAENRFGFAFEYQVHLGNCIGMLLDQHIPGELTSIFSTLTPCKNVLDAALE